MAQVDVPSPDLVAAIAVLARGGAVVYPTETLYGLGADAFSEEGVRQVAGLKGRDAAKPISVLVSSRAMLLEIVASIPSAAERLMGEFWPGPLTLVLAAKPRLSRALTGGRKTIGVRISSHPLAQALVAGLGRPITATSANPGGLDPAVELHQARGYFGARVSAYVDGGRLAGGRGSTVVDLSGEQPVLVREGSIPASALRIL